MSEEHQPVQECVHLSSDGSEREEVRNQPLGPIKAAVWEIPLRLPNSELGLQEKSASGKEGARAGIEGRIPITWGPTSPSPECGVFLSGKQAQVLPGVRTYILALKRSLQIIFQRGLAQR